MNPLKILTKDVPPQGLTFHWKRNASEFGFSPELVLLDQLEIEASLSPCENIFLFEGRVKTVVEEQCSRCLKKFPLSLEADFKIDYEPASAQPDVSGHEIELRPEEFDISYYTNDLLELDVDLRDVVLLALPMTPVCSADCPGICVMCGQLKAAGDCDCAQEAVDERWQKLTQLKKKMEEE